MWGLLPSHVALEHHLHDEDQVSSRPVHSASRMYDHASVDGDSNPGHHRAHPANQDVHSPPPHIPLLDPSVNFIFIDDDISTLRRQLIVIKNSAPQLQLPATLLNKRPGLQNRRARSSAHIKPTSTNTQLTVIYFASLSKFRYIRELVQSIFRSANQTFPLPEVFVLPKPVGPRRLLTALHTAIKRPFIDASVLPIATSPSSPGGQFLFSSSSRPSPAPSSHQEFDAAFGAHAHAMEQSNGSSSHGPLTPPYNVAPLAPSDPPSPRTSSTEAVEYLEYMSKTSTNLGKDVSSGIVIQSHDGKAQGLFFNPKRGANVNTTSSLPRASRDLEQADQEDRRKTSESTERASDEDNQPLQSPSTDVEPAFVAGTPLSAHVPLTGIMDASPVIPEKSAYVQQQPMQDAEKASTDADHDSPPTLPAVGPALVSLSSQAGSTSSCSMSPPLEAGDRALPLEAFTTSVGGPPPASRSLSDPIVVPSSSVVSEAKVQMPSLNRTITAPSTTNPLMGQHTSSEHAQTSPLHHKTPARDQSPTSTAPEAARERQSPTTQQQQEHVSNIAGPPAAILARSAGRKPRNDYFKSKRKPPTAAVPPVNVLIVEGSLNV